ncbi:nuclease [uncultured Cohaesibacter sp.]|uniref:nuclease n=1 Tax=uncultured Cohaesibacter sp. TaxID=1002546 RepID=UPI0029C79065|nr:nuclease [uncultured Cohaesibacter sp.]
MAENTHALSSHEEQNEYEPRKIFNRLLAQRATQFKQDLPERLLVSQIAPYPALFSPRYAPVDHHIVDLLVSLIRRETTLDPLLVCQCGTEVLLIDGHQRLEAYRKVGCKEPVPVEFFQGSLEDAVLEAGRRNTKVILPMDNAERNDYAWRLVLLDQYSKRDTAAASGISTSQVANMRKIRKELGEEAFACETWFHAMRTFRGLELTEMSDEDHDVMRQAIITQYGSMLGRVFKNKLRHDPEITAMVLIEHLGPDMASDVRDYISYELPSDAMDFEEDEY